jgi:hypothetical protein
MLRPALQLLLPTTQVNGATKLSRESLLGVLASSLSPAQSKRADEGGSNYYRHYFCNSVDLRIVRRRLLPPVTGQSGVCEFSMNDWRDLCEQEFLLNLSRWLSLQRVSRIRAMRRSIRVARPVPGQYIVVFKDEVVDKAPTAARLVAQHGGRLGHVFGLGFNGFLFLGSDEVAQNINKQPDVRFVQENGVAHIAQVAPHSPPGWGLDRINQPALPLDLSGGSDCNNGQGVKLYVMDGGINDPMGSQFGSRLVDLFTEWPPPFGSFRDEQGTGGGHGTSAASIAGGATYGLAVASTIENVKVCNEIGDCNSDWMVDGINAINSDHVSAPTPAVVSISLSHGSDPSLDLAIRNSMTTYGITYIVAAGNNGSDACNYSPGDLGTTDGIITVGATSLLGPSYDVDRRADFSNYGACVDIFAPGLDVDSLDYISGSPTAPRLFSGTSAATPYVAGEAARTLSSNDLPGLTPAGLEARLKSLAISGVISDPMSSNDRMLLQTYVRCHL